MSNVVFLNNSGDNAGVRIGSLKGGTVFRTTASCRLDQCLMVLLSETSAKTNGKVMFTCLRTGSVDYEDLDFIVFPTPIEIHHARKPRA